MNWARAQAFHNLLLIAETRYFSWYGKRVQPFAQSKSKKAKGVPLFPPFRSEFSGVHHDQSAARLDGLEKEKGTGFRISASREDT